MYCSSFPPPSAIRCSSWAECIILLPSFLPSFLSPMRACRHLLSTPQAKSVRVRVRQGERETRRIALQRQRERHLVRGWGGVWVGMNRWGGRREGCIGQERKGETLQHVTTQEEGGGVEGYVAHPNVALLSYQWLNTRGRVTKRRMKRGWTHWRQLWR
jgi:hypothetical protein